MAGLMGIVMLWRYWPSFPDMSLLIKVPKPDICNAFQYDDQNVTRHNHASVFVHLNSFVPVFSVHTFWPLFQARSWITDLNLVATLLFLPTSFSRVWVVCFLQSLWQLKIKFVHRNHFIRSKRKIKTRCLGRNQIIF